MISIDLLRPETLAEAAVMRRQQSTLRLQPDMTTPISLSVHLWKITFLSMQRLYTTDKRTPNMNLPGTDL